MSTDTEAVRGLNDEFRRNPTIGGQILITQGVQALGADALPDVVRIVAEYDDFNSENDPYAEHDFGAFDFLGERLFFKIDYYDLTLTKGSENPADPVVTKRVLTIMLAAEY